MTAAILKKLSMSAFLRISGQKTSYLQFFSKKCCSIDRTDFLSIEQICYQKKRFSIDRIYAVLSRNPVCRDLRAFMGSDSQPLIVINIAKLDKDVIIIDLI